MDKELFDTLEHLSTLEIDVKKAEKDLDLKMQLDIHPLENVKKLAIIFVSCPPSVQGETKDFLIYMVEKYWSGWSNTQRDEVKSILRGSRFREEAEDGETSRDTTAELLGRMLEIEGNL